MSKRKNTETAASRLWTAIADHLDPALAADGRESVGQAPVEIHNLSRATVSATGGILMVIAKLPGRRQPRRSIKITVEEYGPANGPRIIGGQP